MAKKGKMKISKVKRNNQTTNKMRKKGQLKLQRHKPKVQTQKQHAAQQEIQYSSASEPSDDEFGDMLNDDEQQYLISRLSKQPQLLSNVPEEEKQNKRSRKRKKENKEKPPRKPNTMGSDSGAESEGLSDSDLEDKYEQEQAERPVKKMRPLLPIKTKEGLMERAEECEESEEESQSEQQQKPTKTTEDQPSEMSDSDSGNEGTGEDDSQVDGDQKVVSAVELMAARRDKLQHDKLRIGALCSSLLESPEKKLKNLFPILYLMEERLKDNTLNLHSVRKLATLSAFEVFKDILPEYVIRHQDYSNVKLKKDTLSLYKYEKELLEFYKRYLQRLEKAAGVLRLRKGDNRKVDESTLSLALVSLQCMCGLLAARPYFNYAPNVAQSVIPLLDSRHERARGLVTSCCTEVFKDDQKGDITLVIVRLINQLVKRRGERLCPSALDCLLSLRIRDVDMDAEAELKHKKRLDEKHKKRIVNLSKKEKKRNKKLKEVERELLETQAQESELARRTQLTEVTKTVFHIYFRLLKTAPRSQLLAAALTGLAKFTHVINVEYYSDLVSVLGSLVSDGLVGARERLLCVRTVLAVLAGAGDALNLDPANFHAYLYSAALGVHAGASHRDAPIILESINLICARSRRVSPAVLQAFAKRLATLAPQLLHNGALACLGLLHQLAQQSKAVSSLMELDSEWGSGRFDPTLASPEHCHAHSARLYELSALRRHAHVAVRDATDALLKGQAQGAQCLRNMTPVQIFEAYDGSQMAFKPAVPPPKRTESQKKITPTHTWTQNSLKELCEAVENSVDMNIISDR